MGASEDVDKRLQQHYSGPPERLRRDMVKWKGKLAEGRTRKEWFLSQVKVHLESTGMWTSWEASRQEGRFIARHPNNYNIIKSGTPAKCRQGFAIMASRRHYNKMK